MKAIIYALCEPGTEVIRYVGKTETSLEFRLYQHLQERQKTKKAIWIKELKDKNQVPNIIELETCSVEEVDELETYWMYQCKTWGFDLLNSFTQRGSRKINIISEVCSYNIVNKTSSIFYNQKLNKELLSLLNTYKIENDCIWGKSLEECLNKLETIKRKKEEFIKTSCKKVYCINIETKEITEHISIADSAKYVDITSKKMSDYLNDNLGRPQITVKGFVLGFSVEECNDKLKQYEFNVVNKKNKSKGLKIKCVETGVIFNSITEASKEMRLDRDAIGKICKGTLKQTKGYSFIYV